MMSDQPRPNGRRLGIILGLHLFHGSKVFPTMTGNATLPSLNSQSLTRDLVTRRRPVTTRAKIGSIVCRGGR